MNSFPIMQKKTPEVLNVGKEEGFGMTKTCEEDQKRTNEREPILGKKFVYREYLCFAIVNPNPMIILPHFILGLNPRFRKVLGDIPS